MAKLDPEADLKTQVIQVHACLESHKRDFNVFRDETTLHFETMGGALAVIDQQVTTNTTSLAHIRRAMASAKDAQDRWKRTAKAQMDKTDVSVDQIADSVGAKKPNATVAGMSQRKAVTGAIVIAALAAVPGTLALIKVLTPVITMVLAAIGAVR